MFRCAGLSSVAPPGLDSGAFRSTGFRRKEFSRTHSSATDQAQSSAGSCAAADPEVVFPCVNFRFRVTGMALTPPIVMTIAGFDPSSGAGITADIKTIAAHECYGVCCITALTVQSTQGVRRVEGVDPKIIRETLRELVSDIGVSAIHIGMLGNAQVVEVVADFLEKARLPHVVLDPILKSSSGADLLDAAGNRVLIKQLIPLAEVVTPNLDEASVSPGSAVT